MKTCMKCGGSTKKMQKGGALKPLGAKIGVGTNVAGMIGMGVKAISDRVKAKKAEKKEKGSLDKKQKGGVTKGNWEFNKDGSLKTFESESKKRLSENIKTGNTGLKRTDTEKGKLHLKEDIKKKKYQKGGGVQKIVGMPGYNAKTNTMKSGGSAKKYAKGGSTFGMLSVKAGIDKNPKPTAADRIAGAKKNKRK